MTVTDSGSGNFLTKWIQLKVPRVGVWYAVLGCLLFAFSEACAKFIAGDINVEVIVCVRYCVHGFITAPLLIKSTSLLPSVSPAQWGYVVLCGFFVGITSFAANYSYYYIPLLDSIVLTNAQPVFAAVISWLWLKEKVTLYDIGIIILTLVGVVIACQPTFIFGNIDDIDSTSRMIGSLFGLLCALFMALSTCFMRKLKEVSSSVIMYFQGLMGAATGFVIGLAIQDLYIKSSITILQLIVLVLIGVLGFLARGLFTLAVQTEDATLICVVQTLEIPFTFFVQLVMLNTFPNALSILGAIIVMASTTSLAAKKSVKKTAIIFKESFRSRFKPSIVKSKDNENNDEKKTLKPDHIIDYGLKN